MLTSFYLFDCYETGKNIYCACVKGGNFSSTDLLCCKITPLNISKDNHKVNL